MKNFGIKIRMRFMHGGNLVEEELRNVTEIHFNHSLGGYGKQDKTIDQIPQNSIDGQIAFESNIHGTGINRHIRDILEFEATPEIEKAREF